ncbi:MAG: 50S ribosomal protein L24 [Gammaproteobacteria bacterium]
MHKIKKGDDVIVITGKAKGARGSVVRVLPEGRVIVENVNMVKKHTKPNPGLGRPGGIIEKEAPLDLSNVALFNPVTKRGDRVGFKRLEDNRKVRYFKSSGETVDV